MQLSFVTFVFPRFSRKFGQIWTDEPWMKQHGKLENAFYLIKCLIIVVGVILYGLCLWPVKPELWLASSRALFSRNTHRPLTGSHKQRKSQTINSLFTSNIRSWRQNLKLLPCSIDLAFTWSKRQGLSLRLFSEYLNQNLSTRKLCILDFRLMEYNEVSLKGLVCQHVTYLPFLQALQPPFFSFDVLF